MADPRVLDPKIRGQLTGGYAVPPSQDQFYGQGMSAQPTFLEKMVKMFTNPNDPMQPMAMEAPVGAGLAITERNIPAILKKLQELGSNYFDSPQQFAMKYIAAKYPKLSGIPNEISAVNPIDLGSLEAGRYLPTSNSINLSNHPGYSRGQMVQTLAHEIIHALQASRGENFDNYTPASKSFTGYLSQPTEEGARQAGATALDTMHKFVRMAIEHVRNNPQGNL